MLSSISGNSSWVKQDTTHSISVLPCSNPDVAILTPDPSPGVSHNIVFVAIFISTIPNRVESLVNVSSAVLEIKYSGLVVLEIDVVGVY